MPGWGKAFVEPCENLDGHVQPKICPLVAYANSWWSSLHSWWYNNIIIFPFPFQWALFLFIWFHMFFIYAGKKPVFLMSVCTNFWRFNLMVTFGLWTARYPDTLSNAHLELSALWVNWMCGLNWDMIHGNLSFLWDQDTWTRNGPTICLFEIWNSTQCNFMVGSWKLLKVPKKDVDWRLKVGCGSCSRIPSLFLDWQPQGYPKNLQNTDLHSHLSHLRIPTSHSFCAWHRQQGSCSSGLIVPSRTQCGSCAQDRFTSIVQSCDSMYQWIYIYISYIGVRDSSREKLVSLNHIFQRQLLRKLGPTWTDHLHL